MTLFVTRRASSQASLLLQGFDLPLGFGVNCLSNYGQAPFPEGRTQALRRG
jgi:hypothetical protein